jgi:integrase
MTISKPRRRFGNVRQRSSGRWQARYVGPDGIERTAPHTFDSERAAERWLTVVESEIIRNHWRPPEAGEVGLDGYATRWIAERKLAPRTREGYEDLMRLHIRPYLGHLVIGAIRPQTIRTWRRHLLDAGVSEPQAVKSYCLLRAVLNTAMREDRLIVENPCRIRGYDRYHTPERPTATVEQVYRLADAMPARYRALVLVAALTGIRWGELAACVAATWIWTVRVCGCPVSWPRFGTGWSSVRPSRRLGVERWHFLWQPWRCSASIWPSSCPTMRRRSCSRAAKGLLRSGNFLRAVDWPGALVRAGLPSGFHFHDLRYTGNTLAAAAGASTRELMHRMGHASMRAALIYQHATSERDREIAAGIDRRLAAHSPRPAEVADPDGGGPNGPAGP